MHVQRLIDLFALSQGIRLPTLPSLHPPSNPEEIPFWVAVRDERRRRYAIARQSHPIQTQQAAAGERPVQAASGMAPQMSRATFANQNPMSVSGTQAMGPIRFPASGMPSTQSASPFTNPNLPALNQQAPDGARPGRGATNPNLPAPNQRVPIGIRPGLGASGRVPSFPQRTLPSQHPMGAHGTQTVGTARFPTSGATASTQSAGLVSFGRANPRAPNQQATASAHPAQATSSMAAPQSPHLPDSTRNQSSRQPPQVVIRTRGTRSTVPAAVAEQKVEAKDDKRTEDDHTQGTKRPASEPFTEQESKRLDGPLPKRKKQDQEGTKFPVFFLVNDLRVRSYTLMAVSPEKEAVVNSVLLGIRRVARAKYAQSFKSWCNGKSESCLCHYVFHKEGAKNMAWQDDAPHKVACLGCVGRQEPCVILDVDDQNETSFLVLPRPAPSDSTASVWLS